MATDASKRDGILGEEAEAFAALEEEKLKEAEAIQKRLLEAEATRIYNRKRRQYYQEQVEAWRREEETHPVASLEYYYCQVGKCTDLAGLVDSEEAKDRYLQEVAFWKGQLAIALELEEERRQRAAEKEQEAAFQRELAQHPKGSVPYCNYI